MRLIFTHRSYATTKKSFHFQYLQCPVWSDNLHNRQHFNSRIWLSELTEQEHNGERSWKSKCWTSVALGVLVLIGGVTNPGLSPTEVSLYIAKNEIPPRSLLKGRKLPSSRFYTQKLLRQCASPTSIQNIPIKYQAKSLIERALSKIARLSLIYR